jgi:hypothetical protein
MGSDEVDFRWRRHLRAASTVGRGVIADVTRWERVEIDALRLLAGGLGLALPVAIGNARGDLGAGMVAAMGALIVSSSGHAGRLQARFTDLLNSTIAGAAGITIGLICDRSDPARSVVPVLTAIVVALIGGLRPSAAKAGAMLLVFEIIGGTLASTPFSTLRVVEYVVAGSIAASALSLIAYGVGHHILRRHLPLEDVARRSWSADLKRWWTGLERPSGWLYVLRLGSCMAAGEVVMHLRHTPHSYWILLTIVLVVQRDHANGLARAVERGLGTALGVLVGAVLLNAIPTWALITALGVIGGVRIHLKAANYTLYALVMTPLIAVLSGLGHDLSGALLRERLVDTAIGCAIALVLGYAAWRPWMVPS